MVHEYKMNASILDSVKDIIGIDPRNIDFDRDLILAINAVLFILYQEGLTDENYRIYDNTKTWEEILLKEQEPEALNTIIEWTGLKTKLLFDPPTIGAVMESINNQIHELEYRLYTQGGGY